MNACQIEKGLNYKPVPKSNVNTQFLDNIIKELEALPDCDLLNGAANKYIGIIEDQLNDALKQLEFLGPYTALLTIPTNPKKLSKYLKDFVKTVIGASIFEQIKSYKEQLEAYKNGLERIQAILKEKAESLESCKINPDRIELESCVLSDINKFLNALDVDLGDLNDLDDSTDTTIEQDIQAAIGQLQLGNSPTYGSSFTGDGSVNSPLELDLNSLNSIYATTGALDQYISTQEFEDGHILVTDPHNQYVLKSDLNTSFDIVGYFHVYFDAEDAQNPVLQLIEQSDNMFTFTFDVNFNYASAPFLNSTDYLVMADIQHRSFDSIMGSIVRYVDILGNSIRISAITRPINGGDAGGRAAVDARFWVIRKPQF